MIDVLLAGIGAGALDRWLGDRSRVDPEPWYKDWVDSVEQRFNGGQVFQGVIALLLVLVPVLVLVVLLRWVAWQFGMLTGFALDIVLLFFCIRIDGLHQSANRIGHALKRGRLLEAQSLLRAFSGHSVLREDEAVIAEAAVETILCRANTQVIAPLFWFALLGPVGSVMQMLTRIVRQRWQGTGDRFGQFGLPVQQVYCAINWLPARCSAMCFAMVGNFSDAVHGWRDTPSGWCNSETVVATTGLAALQIERAGQEAGEEMEPDEESSAQAIDPGYQHADSASVRRAVALAWRSVLFLGVLAIVMSLASWLGV
ncbi:MAG: regulatory signaling modulator protein AmpE [Gammaproteobacteria bacterium]|nr:regulatory signaling modulator protein AmpE [Gammaproteobacteria bacterium]